MPTGTLSATWEGRSGRRYVPIHGSRVRHGPLATVRKIGGVGPGVGTSTVEEGTPLALKLWHEGDEDALDQLQAEARILVDLTATDGDLPCPRLYDLVGTPLVTGLVMEWCPADLERWWREKLTEPDAFGRLMATLAEAARRVGDFHDTWARSRRTAHGDLKPSNILLSQDGRWLVSDFGSARSHQRGDGVWESTRALVDTENFLAPELLFDARKPHPVSMDAWSFGATTFALLRLQRLVLDGAQVPSNGTHSPRLRTTRMSQVIDVYTRDPIRFRDRDLDPSAFDDPLGLPEQDVRALHECVRGVFGAEDAMRERQLGDQLRELVERTLSVDPAHRYTSMRDLAAAYDALTRSFIALSATAQGVKAPEADIIDPEELIRSRDDALRRNRSLQESLAAANDEIADLHSQLAFQDLDELDDIEPEVRIKVVRPPTWWGFALIVLLVLQLATILLAVVGLLVPFLLYFGL